MTFWLRLGLNRSNSDCRSSDRRSTCQFDDARTVLMAAALALKLRVMQASRRAFLFEVCNGVDEIPCSE
jgi:hypothetical protein